MFVSKDYNEQNSAMNAFYSPISKYDYLTPLQRKKLREKRNINLELEEGNVKYELSEPKTLKKKLKQKRHLKPKLKAKSKELMSKKFIKAIFPQVRCSAAQLISQNKSNSIENKKFFKTRSPEHFRKARFIVPLMYKRPRLDFNTKIQSASVNISQTQSNENLEVQASKKEEQKIDSVVFNSIKSPLIEKVTSANEENIYAIARKEKNFLEINEKFQNNTIKEFQNETKTHNSFMDDLDSLELSVENVNVETCELETRNQEPILSASPIQTNVEETKSNPKLYPLFYKKNETKLVAVVSNVAKKSFHTKDTSKGSEQMIIDAGQKEIGAKQCKTCSMIYTIGHEEDENLHSKYHDMYFTNLRFPGWKKEQIIGTYYDGRIIKILEDDKSFKLKKVKEVLMIANRDLGFSSSEFPVRPNIHFLLFISSDKRVRGCLVAESITSAAPVVLGEKCLSTNEQENSKIMWKLGDWYASSETVPAICGINRIWVANDYQRKKVATRLVDCLRSNFIYGHVVSLLELAFTDPTSDGREFAAAYTGTDNFLVYK